MPEMPRYHYESRTAQATKTLRGTTSKKKREKMMEISGSQLIVDIVLMLIAIVLWLQIRELEKDVNQLRDRSEGQT